MQYAAAMGFETVAIARGAAKADFAKELGAHHYIDSTADTSVADALQALGGARVVLATAANSGAITATVEGLAPAVSWWSSARTPSRWESARPSCS